jgi:phosphoglycerol transferase MdoB-like AlkP superfamily enzyme
MRWSKVNNDLGYAKPYWSYEDIGVFFLIVVLLGSVLRLFVRFELIPRSALANPSFGLQFAVVAALSLALYLVLKLRHHQPVLQPLGWVWPRTAYIVAALNRRDFACMRRCTLPPPSQPEHAACAGRRTARTRPCARPDS